VPEFFTPAEYETCRAACARLIPTDDDPGADGAGVVEYIDGLLGAFSVQPPRIWAGGPTSGRFGGPKGFAEFMTLTPLEELGWRMRIEGSLGLAEREWNGPVVGWQQRYREGLSELGADFSTAALDEQDRRLHAVPDFTALLYEHACEGMYAAPEYGGNRELVGWQYIGFAGDVQPRGYSDAEVSEL
jgi:hypothetical protein